MDTEEELKIESEAVAAATSNINDNVPAALLEPETSAMPGMSQADLFEQKLEEMKVLITAFYVKVGKIATEEAEAHKNYLQMQVALIEGRTAIHDGDARPWSLTTEKWVWAILNAKRASLDAKMASLDDERQLLFILPSVTIPSTVVMPARESTRFNEIFDDEDSSSPSSSSHKFVAHNPLCEQQERQSQRERQSRLGDKEQESPSTNEEGAALAAAVLIDAPPVLLQLWIPVPEVENAQPPPQAAVRGLPQSLPESADAIQSCPARGGRIDVSLLPAQEFVLVFSSKVWDPGGLFFSRCHGGRACDTVAPKEARRSYANSVV
jgi:hypothetical protein